MPTKVWAKQVKALEAKRTIPPVRHAPVARPQLDLIADLSNQLGESPPKTVMGKRSASLTIDRLRRRVETQGGSPTT